MRIFPGILLLLFLVSACLPKPDTPVMYPEEFDQEAYALQLQHAKDSIEKRKTASANDFNAPTPSEIIEETLEEEEVDKPQPRAEFVSDTIPLVITYGTAVSDTLIRPGQQYVFSFDTDTAKRLLLEAKGDSDSVRLKISKVHGPETEAAGPFLNPAEVELEERGLWHVTITDDENYSGPLRFEVRLGW